MDLFDSSLYVYQADNGSLTDLELLELIKTSVQTARSGGNLYFACDSLISGPGFSLVREPVAVEPEQPQE